MFTAFIDKRIRGLVLIELLLALSIALVINSVLIEMYLTNRQSHYLQISLSSIQENANTVIALLTAEIRKAGNIGCSVLTKGFPLVGADPSRLTYTNVISAKKGELIVRYGDFSRGIVEMVSQDLSRLVVRATTPFSEKDFFIISDCRHAELFQAKKIGSTPDFSQTFLLMHPLHTAFSSKAEVSKLIIHRYIVNKTARVNADGSPIYALFLMDEHQRKMELVESIQEIHFLKDQKGVAFNFIVQAGSIKKIWYHYVGLKA